MRSYSDYRAQARETMECHWGEAAILTLIYFLVALLIESISGGSEFLGSTTLKSAGSAMGSLLSLLVVAPMGSAFTMLFLHFVRGEMDLQFGNVWAILRSDYARILSATLIISVMIILGIFTLGILSVYFAFAYAMVPYLLRDYPELTWREAMQTSREMMNGHKMELFVLELTFIGWYLLIILTLGLATFFVVPYTQTAYALFYEDLKKETIIDTDGRDEVQEAEVIE